MIAKCYFIIEIEEEPMTRQCRDCVSRESIVAQPRLIQYHVQHGQRLFDKEKQ